LARGAQGATIRRMNLLWITAGILLFIIAAVTLFDLIRNHDRRGTWANVGWAVLIVILPLVGSIIYWATRTTSPEEVEAQRVAEASMRQDASRTPFDSTSLRR
jgi:hypothetical protein